MDCKAQRKAEWFARRRSNKKTKFVAEKSSYTKYLEFQRMDLPEYEERLVQSLKKNSNDWVGG